MTTVRLSAQEAMIAIEVGGRLELRARLKRYRDHYPPVNGRDGFRQHIEGAGAELAVAKYLGRYWSAADLDTFAGPDITPAIGVRLRQTGGTDLGIHSTEDDDELALVLVYGSLPVYDLVGWIRAGDGKRPEWVAPHIDGLYFCPPSALRPLDELHALRGAA